MTKSTGTNGPVITINKLHNSGNINPPFFSMTGYDHLIFGVININLLVSIPTKNHPSNIKPYNLIVAVFVQYHHKFVRKNWEIWITSGILTHSLRYMKIFFDKLKQIRF